MSMLPTAQHAWEDTFHDDATGRALGPRFHRLLMLDVVRRPTVADVERLEANLRSLERRFDRSPAGLLMCLGWGSGWFERHTSLPALVDRPRPMSEWEDPALEEIDACLHLASDDESRLAAITNELFGRDGLDPCGALELREIRQGFVGPGLAAERTRVAGVPVDAPMMLGFHSGLRGNQATEGDITIAEGPLAGGTTMHVSRIELDLARWYAHDRDQRAALMFSPQPAPAKPTRSSTTLRATPTTYRRRRPVMASSGTLKPPAAPACTDGRGSTGATSRRSTAADPAPTSSPCSARSRTSTPHAP